MYRKHRILPLFWCFEWWEVFLLHPKSCAVTSCAVFGIHDE